METLTSHLGPLTTLFVGFFAFAVYFLKERRIKINAAKVIWLEIKSTEYQIKEIQKRELSYTDKPILRTNSWMENRHLIIDSFDNDEISIIDEFYNSSEYIEHLRQTLILSRQQSLDSKSDAIQSQLMANIISHMDDRVSLDNKRSKFIDISNLEGHMFNPMEPVKLAQKEIEIIRFISGTSSATKLKAIAKSKK